MLSFLIANPSVRWQVAKAVAWVVCWPCIYFFNQRSIGLKSRIIAVRRIKKLICKSSPYNVEIVGMDDNYTFLPTLKEEEGKLYVKIVRMNIGETDFGAPIHEAVAGLMIFTFPIIKKEASPDL